MIDFHASAGERAKADKLSREDVSTNGPRIHDLLVSCYTASGEDGRPEDVHERRMSDGACRCGYNLARRWDVTLTRDGSSETVHTFTWGVRYSSAYARVVEIIDRPDWDGWSFKINETPTLIRGEF